MNANDVRRWLSDALSEWATHAPELRDLDAAVGDGDLGVTVSHGAVAVQTALESLGEHTTPTDLCRASGAAFAKGSPSTMAALLGGGLLSAAKALADTPEFGEDAAHVALHAVIESVMTRGRSMVGDKTVLDALVPSLEAMEATAGSPPRRTLTAMADAADAAVAATAASVARRGRAAWLQERTAGHPDPGATAYALLLRSLEHTWPRDDGPSG